MNPYLKIPGISAEISILRSNRRSLAAEITPDAKILVRAPRSLPVSEIVRFLSEKSDTLEHYLQKQRISHQKFSALPPFSRADLEQMAQQAAAVIPERVRFYAARIGVTYGRITIRNQKTRWGSCSAAGNLNFNCLLMAAPTDVLDSVIVHELCHRLHPNHSKAFYAEVLRAFPDYDRCHQWLKDNGAVLIHRMLAGENKA